MPRLLLRNTRIDRDATGEKVNPLNFGLLQELLESIDVHGGWQIE